MIRFAIIENERFALENLKQMVQALRSDFELCFSAESVEETVAFLRETAADHLPELVFMDVELVDGTCFEIFRQVTVDIPIIFTTAYDHYAIAAFKVNSVDYLLKPIGEKDVAQALAKWERQRQYQQKLPYRKLAEDVSRAQTIRRRILINSGDSFGYVNFKDVAFFLSEDKYVFVYLHSGHRHMTTYASLNDLESELDAETFFRIARNIIASIDAVKSVHKFFNGRLHVTLAAGHEEQSALVSAARRDAFLNWMGGGNV